VSIYAGGGSWPIIATKRDVEETETGINGHGPPTDFTLANGTTMRIDQ
jgi:hypothetical protein